MGLGWTIDGTEYYRKIEAHPDNTNNKAEYLALVALLRTLAKQLPPYMALSTRFGPF
jgi:ribonuclease HI